MRGIGEPISAATAPSDQLHEKTRARERGLLSWADRFAYFAILFFVAGMILIPLRELSFFSALPGDLRDARFNSIILEHLYQWLTGRVASLWSPRFFFPYHGTLAFSVNHFGTGAIYVLSRALGMTRERSFQIWFVLAYVLNYWCCYYALRRLDFRWREISPAVGAFIFTFSLPVMAQDVHAHLGYRFAVPLACLACWKFLSRRSFKSFGVVLVWTAVQFYCDIYLGYFLCLLLVAFAMSFVWSRMRLVGITTALRGVIVDPISNASSLERRSAIFSIVISSVAVAGLLLPYYFISKTYGFRRRPAEIALMLPRPASYLLADRSILSSWLGSKVTNIPIRWEHQMFIGFIPLLLVLLGLVSCFRGNSRSGRLYAWSCFLLIALTLSVGGRSLYLFLCRLPGVDSMRAITRIILVMLFPVSVLAGLGTATLLGNTGAQYRKLRVVMLALVASFLVAEAADFQRISMPVGMWRARTNELKRMLPASFTRDSILYVEPSAAEPRDFGEVDGMMLAQEQGVATVNGYSGNIPTGFAAPEGCSTAFRRLAIGSVSEHVNRTEFCGFMHRLVIVPAAICRVDPASSPCPVPYAGALAQAVMQGTRVRVEGLRIDQSTALWADVEIRNTTDMTIPSVSTTNDPVRLSWYFQKVGGQDEWPRWETRWDLGADVPPRGHITEAVRITAPTTPGRYLLRMTVVQENIAWFQDRGMPIATAEQKIVVDDAGRASIGY